MSYKIILTVTLTLLFSTTGLVAQSVDTNEMTFNEIIEAHDLSEREASYLYKASRFSIEVTGKEFDFTIDFQAETILIDTRSLSFSELDNIYTNLVSGSGGNLIVGGNLSPIPSGGNLIASGGNLREGSGGNL